MTVPKQKETLDAALKKEIMLQINQRLYAMGMISKSVYEWASVKIVSGT